MLNGDVIANGWRDENVKEALDLCLACKGCKGDCPVNVDMATYKAEFLSHYWEGRLRPRHAYAFGLIDQWARLASDRPGIREPVHPAAGAEHDRQEGRRHAARSGRFRRSRRRPSSHGFESARRAIKASRRVILWPDTFNNYFFPETAQAAVEVLEHFGYQVKVPMQHLCCGRPLYDYGFLDRAKAVPADEFWRHSADEIDAGTPDGGAGAKLLLGVSRRTERPDARIDSARIA